MVTRDQKLLGVVFDDFDACENPDWNVAQIYEKYSRFGARFVLYPVGGCDRYRWQPSKNGSIPPSISLVDAQMGCQQWQCNVACTVSKWIDPDAEDEWLSQLSIIHLKKELDHCAYLGVERIIFELQHLCSPRLANVINDYLRDKSAKFIICVVLPTCVDYLANDASSSNSTSDVWSVWADFRAQCVDHLDSLAVCLKFCLDCDDEFLSSGGHVDRWKAEPLWSLWLDCSLFTTNPDGTPTISSFHRSLFSALASNVSHIILSSTNQNSESVLNLHLNAVGALLATFAKESPRPIVPEYVASSFDILQEPLQPLSHNLESVVYSTFEMDRVKYDLYRDAIASALRDLCQRSTSDERHFVVYVLGAGRGGLIRSTLEAQTMINRSIGRSGVRHVTLNIFAVEKNESACLSLRYFNKVSWSNTVTILNSDMRDLVKHCDSQSVELLTPNIIVSELLGSFGDNELCPECLDGVLDLITAETISIPQSYQSFIAPIQSVPLLQRDDALRGEEWDNRRSARRNIGRNSNDKTLSSDCLYTVGLKDYCLLDKPQPCFRFSHPNFRRFSNERNANLRFHVRMPCELVGFAGFFEACLYKSADGDAVILSTVPDRHTPCLFSWFPAFLPARKAVRCENDDTIDLSIARRSDANGVWYEWAVLNKDSSDNRTKQQQALQNDNGSSYYMRLF